MLQPLCLTAGTVYLGLKVSPVSVVIVAKYFSCLTKRHLARSCGQLQILAEFEGDDFGAGASFLLSTLSVQTI